MSISLSKSLSKCNLSLSSWQVLLPWSHNLKSQLIHSQSPLSYSTYIFFSYLLSPFNKDKVKWSESHSVVSDSLRPMDHTVHGILQARILEWVAFPFSRGSSHLRDQTQVSCIAGRFFTSWATGKPKNTGGGNLFLLQWIFPTQGSNQGLLLCRRILYQLSYQGTPTVIFSANNCPVTWLRIHHPKVWHLAILNILNWRNLRNRLSWAAPEPWNHHVRGSLPILMKGAFSSLRHRGNLNRWDLLFPPIYCT